MKISYSIALTALLLSPLSNSAMAATEISCSGVAAPVISKADVDGNGVVNGKDIALFAKYMGKKSNRLYSPIFDRVEPYGVIDIADKFSATRDMGQTTTPEEQALAKSCKEVADTVFTGW